jgi:hypothetical protein
MSTHLGSAARRRWSRDRARSERLGDELRRLVSGRHPGAQIESMIKLRRPARSSWSVEDVHMRLDDGSSVRLIWKDLDREAPESNSFLVKPAQVLDLRREPWVYKEILGPSGQGADCWGAVSDEEAGVHWLFLEPVQGEPLCECGDPRSWAEAAAWLGRFHALHLGTAPAGSPLLSHDASLYAWWFERALEKAHEGTVTFIRGLAPTYRTAVRTVMSSPLSIIHGEFCPANILVDNSATPPRIVPLDWEMAGRGPAVLDLAALVAGGWNDRERRAMASAYRNAWKAAGAPSPSIEGLLRLLDGASLLHAVQWLGWSDLDLWRPPNELRNDWLADAVRSADRLRAR